MPKKLFYTNGAARAEITELETQVSGLQESATVAETENTRLTTENTRLAGEVVSLTTERDEAVAAMDETEKALTKANADLATANAALNTANGKLSTFDADVEKAASARFAGLGGDPLPSAAQDDNGKQALAGLTGLERATAAHKAAAAAKKGK